jgi:hypothetical protein
MNEINENTIDDFYDEEEEAIYISLGITDKNAPIPYGKSRHLDRQLSRLMKKRLFESDYDESQGEDAFFIIKNISMRKNLEKLQSQAPKDPCEFDQYKKSLLDSIKSQIRSLRLKLADPVEIHAHIKYTLAHWENLQEIVNDWSPNFSEATNDIVLKSFPDYLLHEEKDLLAAKIKSEFQTERGKSIHILIKALKEYQPSLLRIPSRGFNKFYTVMKSFLGRDIGSYQSIQDYIYDPQRNRSELQETIDRLKSILKSIDKEEEEKAC